MKMLAPFLNPVRFHDLVSGKFAIDMIPDFFVRRGYCQKFTTSDVLYLQFHFTQKLSDFKFYVMTNAGEIIDTIHTTQITNITFSSLYSYEMKYTFTQTGTFILRADIKYGTQNAVAYSEPIKVAQSFKNTISVFFNHDENDFDVLFLSQNCVGFTFRVEGGLLPTNFTPSGKYEIYKDLDYKSKQLNAYVFNIERYTFGPSTGIPNYIVDKLNRMLSLATFRINDVDYVRADGAKWERSGVDSYPLAGWTIDLIRRDNAFSDSIDLVGSPIVPLTWDSGYVKFDNTLITFDQTQN